MGGGASRLFSTRPDGLESRPVQWRADSQALYVYDPVLVPDALPKIYEVGVGGGRKLWKEIGLFDLSG